MAEELLHTPFAQSSRLQSKSTFHNCRFSSTLGTLFLHSSPAAFADRDDLSARSYTTAKPPALRAIGLPQRARSLHIRSCCRSETVSSVIGSGFWRLRELSMKGMH